MAVVRCQLSILFLALVASNCADGTSIAANTSCEKDNPNSKEDLSIKEIYDNIDNNCNGQVDEDYMCHPDSRQRCWQSDSGDIYKFLKNPELGLNSALNGECKQGEQFCRELDIGSAWGIFEDGVDGISGTQDDVWIQNGCVGSVLPATEQCDGKDNNCDGRTDEGLKRSCWSGPVNSGTLEPASYLVFYDPVDNPDGLCKLGTELCQDGRWSGCLYEVLPTVELCDGIDNNCNGEVDDFVLSLGTSCGLTDIGACEFGTLQCSTGGSGADLICQSAVLPENEVCDNIDNDCDGQVDEELYRRCTSICEDGIETCISGNWQNCSAQLPVQEQCNELDDDCDGLIDEELLCACPAEYIGFLMPCKRPELVCGLGFFTCECADERCETTVQSDCSAICAYQEQPNFECNETVGLSEIEQCNGWDDDCDGFIDEELTRECYSGPIGTSGVGECYGDIQICDTGRWGQLDDRNNFVANVCMNQMFPDREICDEKDNDCDGLIDEELSPHDKVDMVFAIDISGSMSNKIIAVRNGIAPYVAEFEDTEHMFSIVIIPDSAIGSTESRVLLDLSTIDVFMNTIRNVQSTQNAIEPQYDTIFDIANKSMPITFRDDAWPIVIMITDELAQSNHNIGPAQIQQVIQPCTIGLCTPNDKLEIYSIVPRQFFVEWCAPANIAKQCYDLPENVTSNQITGYLNEIFSDVCR